MGANENATQEEKIKKTAREIVGNIGYIITILIVIGFILFGLISPTIKNDNIWLILLGSASLLGLGFTLNAVLPIQGLIDGDNTDAVKSAKKRVNETYECIKDKTQYTDAYAFVKNNRATKQVIDTILKKELLEYNRHFDKKGCFKYDSFLVIKDTDNEFTKQEKQRKNEILESLSKGIKITYLTRADVLAQDDATANDPNKRGRTEKQFLLQHSRQTAIFKVFSAIFGGAFGATFAGLAWGDIIYRVVWSIILVSFAFVGYIKAYRYKTVEYAGRLRQSAEWQTEMYNMIVSKELDVIVNEHQVELYGDDNEKALEEENKGEGNGEYETNNGAVE